MLLVSNSLSNSFQCFQCFTVRSRLTVKREWVNGLFHMILKNTDSDVQKVPYSSGSLLPIVIRQTGNKYNQYNRVCNFILVLIKWKVTMLMSTLALARFLMMQLYKVQTWPEQDQDALRVSTITCTLQAAVVGLEHSTWSLNTKDQHPTCLKSLATKETNGIRQKLDSVILIKAS